MAGRQGKGNRITKPRSAKQQAHAKRYSNAHVTAPAGAGLTNGSWWTKPMQTREEFDTAAAHETRRMAESKFGGSRSSNQLGAKDQGF